MAVEPTTELIRAGPGSGKTMRLTQLVAEAVETDGLAPARILWLALDRPAQQRQRDYFVTHSSRVGRTMIPAIDTYESVAQQVLEESASHWGRGVVRPLAERLLVGEVIQQTTASVRHYRAEEVRTSPRFRDDVADFIAELKRCKIDTETFRERIVPGLPHADALADLAEIYEHYQEKLQDAAVYDLRGIIWLALLALADEQLAESWRQRYDLIVADDLQDATLLQIELLATLCGPRTCLAAAYEPAQAIYRFRGAVEDPSAVLESLLGDRELFRIQLPADQAGRMAPEVARVARRFAQCHDLDSGPVGEGEHRGAAAVRVYRTFGEELGGLGDDIISLLEQGEPAPDEIAVIARSRQQVQAAREHLALRGIPVAGQEATAGGWAAGHLLTDIIALLTYVQNQDTYPTAVRQEETAQANLALCRLAVWAGGEELAVARVHEQCLREGAFMLSDERAGAVEGLSRLAQVVPQALDEGAVAGMNLVLHETGLFPQLCENVPAEVVGALVALLRSLGDAEEALVRVIRKGLSFEQARSVIEMSAGLAAALDSSGVRVMTAHDVRGLEFDTVYLIGLSEGAFPAPALASRLLPDETVRALRDRVREYLGVSTATLTFAGFGEAASEALAEEIRLFYTCLSRARRKLMLSCYIEEEGAKVSSSEFIVIGLPDDFALGSPQEQREAGFECVFWGLADQAPGGRVSHEGCPVVPCAGRPVRTAEVAEPPDVRLPQPEANREPILAQVAPDWPLSAGSVNAYLRCPRQFFFEKLLGLAGEESEAMLYGSLMHEVMAEVNKLPPGERTTERALAIVAEAFASREPEFSSPYSYRIHYERARRALETYAATDLFREESLAREHWFEVDLPDEHGQPHRFRGRIDQVVGADDGIAVVDYKSGKVDGAAALRRSFCYRETDRVREPERKDYQLPIYALALHETEWKQVMQVCLQSLNPDASPPCRRSCVELVADAEGGDESFTVHELGQIAEYLAVVAREIKKRPGFEGHPPKEGCTPQFGACPFALICSEADPS